MSGNLVTVELEGIEDFRAMVKRLVDSVGPAKAEPILKQSADLMTAQVRENVQQINKVTGRLSVSPATRMGKQLYYGVPRTAISFIRYRTAKAAPHAHLVERGARGGQMPAQPFWRPAWDSRRGAMLALIETRVKANIRKAAGRV